MASTQATIDLIVKGSAAVNKLINDVNQLQGAVSRINSQTLDIAPQSLARSANKLEKALNSYAGVAKNRKSLIQEEVRLTKELEQIDGRMRVAAERADKAAELLAQRRAKNLSSSAKIEVATKKRLEDATNEMEALSNQSDVARRSLGRVGNELNKISSGARSSIQTATRLIEENKSLNAASSIRSLAAEYNAFGDSLKRTAKEVRLAEKDIPRMEVNFAKLKSEVSDSRRAIANLEQTINRLGPIEIPIEVKPPRPLSEADLLAGVLPALPAVAGQGADANDAIKRRNEERRAAQAALEQERKNLESLERRAAVSGAKIANRQGQLAQLIQGRTLEVGPSGASNRTGLSVSLNQLQAQAEALTLVANNSSIASNAFNQFTIAAEMASIKLAKAQQSTFSALAAGFSSALPAPPGLGQRPGRPDPIAGARAQVAELIAMIPSLTRSEAALSAHIASLTKVKQLLPFISSEYQAVEGAINSLNDELQQAKSPIATRLGSREQFMQQYQFQVKRLKEADAIVNRQVDLEDKINRAKVDSVTKAKLLESTNRVLQAIDEDRLERARQITRESERQLRAAVDLANENRKKPKAGVYRSDQISPIQGPYILRNAIASGEIVEQSLRNLADRGADVQGRLASLQTILNKAKSGQFEISSKNLGVLVQEVGLAGKYAQLQQKVLQGKAREERVNKLAQEMLSSKQKELDAMERIDKIRQGGVSDEGVQASIKLAEQLAEESDKFLRNMKAKAEVNREADDLAKKQADARAALPNQITKLRILQGEYNKAKERGAQISQEEFDKLGKLVDKISDPGFKTSPLARKDIDYLTQRLDLLRQLRLAEKPSKTKEGAAGPASPVADLALQTKYQRQLNNLYKDQDALLENIGKARIGQEQRERLLFSVDMAREALLTHRLEDSRDITKEVARQLKIEQEISDLQTRQRTKRVNWMTALSRGEEIIAENRTKSDNSLAEEREKSGKRLANQLIELQTLQSNYAGLEARGVKFLEEKAQLTDLVNSLVAKQVPLTKQSADFVGEEIRRLRLYTQLRASQAKTAGTLTTPSKARTPEQLEDQRKRLLDSAQGLEAKVYGLEQKGVLLAGTRLDIEEEILNLKKMQGNATADSLRSSGEFIGDIRRTLNQIGREMAMGVPGAGLAAGLKSLGQARGGREGFLGSLSPAEAIDKIVREFNNGSAFASASTSAGKSGKNVVDTFAKNIKNGAPAAADASRAMAEASTQAINDVYGIASPARFMILLVKNLVDTYVREMQKAHPRIKAATDRAFGNEMLVRADRYNPSYRPLKSAIDPYSSDPQAQFASRARADISRSTTQPFIYWNMLKALPNSYIRGDLIKEAENRNLAADTMEWFMPLQRELGPGKLEKLISFAFAKYLRDTRIPNPWIGIAGDYRDFISKVTAATQKLKRPELALPQSRIAGLLPSVAESAQEQREQQARRMAQRVQQAYLRSEARGLAVMAESAFGRSGGSRPLPAGDFGFMADPARIRRLSGIGRALPPAAAEPGASAAPPALAAEPSKRSRAAAELKQSIANYRKAADNFWEGEDSQFSAVSQMLKASVGLAYSKIKRRLTETRSNAAEQIADSVASDVTAAVGQATAGVSSAAASQGVAGGGVAGGGVAGGGGAGGGGAGPAGAGKDPEDFARRLSSAADQGVEALLTLEELRDPASASINELEALSSVLKEFRGILDPTAEGFDRLDNQLRETIAGLDRMSQVRAADADFLTRRTKDPRKAAAISEGLIGGAFPLLFGQGVGASVGGGLGGFFGGFAGGALGFGLSLIGTAIGAELDKAVTSAKELNNALLTVGDSYSGIRQQGFQFTAELESQIRLLKEAGDFEGAASIERLAIQGTTGDINARGADATAAAGERLAAAWNRTYKSMQASLAIIAAPFMEVLADAADGLASIFQAFNLAVSSVAELARMIPGVAKFIDQSEENAYRLSAEYQDQIAAINKQIYEAEKLNAITETQLRFTKDAIGASRVDAGLIKERSDRAKRLAENELEIKKIRSENPSRTEEQRGKINQLIHQQQRKFLFQEAQLAAEKAQELHLEITDNIREIALQKRQNELQHQDMVLDLIRQQEDLNIEASRRVRDERIRGLEQEAKFASEMADQRMRAEALDARQKKLATDLSIQDDFVSSVMAAIDVWKTGRKQVEKNFEDDQRRIQIEAQKAELKLQEYKYDMAIRIARTNEDSEKKILRMNEGINKQNEEVSRRGYERRLALQILDAEAIVETAKAEKEIARKGLDKPDLDKFSKEQFQRRLVDANVTLKYIEPLLDKAMKQLTEDKQKLRGSRLPTVGALPALTNPSPGVAAATSAVNDQITKGETLISNLKKINGLREVDIELAEAAGSKVVEGIKQMRSSRLELENINKAEAYREKLIASGVNPELAEQLATLKGIGSEAYKNAATLVLLLKSVPGIPSAAIDYAEELRRAVMKEEMLTESALKESGKNKRTRDYIKEATAELRDLEAVALRVSQSIGDAIGDSMSSGITDLIDGTQTAQQVFATFLKNMADILMKEAARIIATYTAIGLAKMFAGLSGGTNPAAGAGPIGQTNWGGGDGGILGNLNVGPDWGSAPGITQIPVQPFKFANGGMFTNSIVSSPTLFKFADGAAMKTGVMGEAGAEAVMPLTRGPGGRLGVDASGAGGGDITVNVSVDATGSRVQGDDAQSAELGRLIGAAVHQEMLKQKRPGGLLAS